MLIFSHFDMDSFWTNLDVLQSDCVTPVYAVIPDMLYVLLLLCCVSRHRSSVLVGLPVALCVCG